MATSSQNVFGRAGYECSAAAVESTESIESTECTERMTSKRTLVSALTSALNALDLQA